MEKDKDWEIAIMKETQGMKTNTVPLVLKTGDKVNIRTTAANLLHMGWSSFKGWKVR